MQMCINAEGIWGSTLHAPPFRCVLMTAGKAPFVYLYADVYKARVVATLSFVYLHADVY